MYKIGDKVRILLNIHGHGWLPGTIVTISSQRYTEGYRAVHPSGQAYFITDNEVEPEQKDWD